MKSTLVIGASENPERYSSKAILALKKHGHPVFALGKNTGESGGIVIQTGQPELENIDTVTLYLNPNHQKDIEDYLIRLNPSRVIFNPGTENPVLKEKLITKGIEVEEACTLVLLATEQY